MGNYKIETIARKMNAALMAICVCISVSIRTSAQNRLPITNHVAESDEVYYSNETFNTIDQNDNTNWFSAPQILTSSYNFNMGDVGVETGTRSCMAIMAGGQSTKVTPTSATSVLHMNVANVKTVRIYGIVQANYRGLRVYANKLTDITSNTQNLAESEIFNGYQVTNNSNNKVSSFILDLQDLDPKEKYMLTIRGWGTANSRSYLYAVKLYASTTPTLIIQKGDTVNGEFKTRVTAKSEMTPQVLQWTNPQGNTSEPDITWSTGIQPEWINVTKDTNNKTITISGTPNSNSYASAEPITYSVTIDDGNTINGSITVDKHVDAAPEFDVIEKNFSFQPGKEINIKIGYKNATNVVVTGLPDDLSYNVSDNVVTISGTMSEQISYPKVMSYTLTPTPLEDYTGDPVSYTGTITAISPDAAKVAFVYTADDVSDMDVTAKIYNVINGNYNVTPILSESIAEYDTETLAAYDLIVLHESANSSSSGAQNVGTWIGSKPILNTKAHMYGTDNWPIMSAAVTDDGTDVANINSVYIQHPLFDGITIDDNHKIAIGGNVRGVNLPGKKMPAQYTIATNSSGNSAILEENTGIDGENKYMMIAIGADNPEKNISESLTDNGRLIIKNACEYLLNNKKIWINGERNTKADILRFSLNGSEGTIDGNKITVQLLSDTTSVDELTDVIPTIITSEKATVVNGDVPMDFSDGKEVVYTVISEDLNTEKKYTVTVELIDAALDAPYSDSIKNSGYIKPQAIYSTDGTLTYMPAYAKNDASFWTENGENEGTASVLRISANAGITIMVRNPGTATISISSTGERELKAYVDGTMISTTKIKSLTKADIKIGVNQTGVHFITIENIGTGTSVVGAINITAIKSDNDPVDPSTDIYETTDTKEIKDITYYTMNGRKIGFFAVENIPAVKVVTFTDGTIRTEKIQKKQ